MAMKLTVEKAMKKITEIISQAEAQDIFLAEIKVERRINEVEDGLLKRRIDTQVYFSFEENEIPETN
jgi:hypothetical protein